VSAALIYIIVSAQLWYAGLSVRYYHQDVPIQSAYFEIENIGIDAKPKFLVGDWWWKLPTVLWNHEHIMTAETHWKWCNLSWTCYPRKQSIKFSQVVCHLMIFRYSKPLIAGPKCKLVFTNSSWPNKLSSERPSWLGTLNTRTLRTLHATIYCIKWICPFIAAIFFYWCGFWSIFWSVEAWNLFEHRGLAPTNRRNWNAMRKFKYRYTMTFYFNLWWLHPYSISPVVTYRDDVLPQCVDGMDMPQWELGARNDSKILALPCAKHLSRLSVLNPLKYSYLTKSAAAILIINHLDWILPSARISLSRRYRYLYLYARKFVRISAKDPGQRPNFMRGRDNYTWLAQRQGRKSVWASLSQRLSAKVGGQDPY